MRMRGADNTGNDSVALMAALDAVESLGREQMVLVPAIPTRSMSARGAAAGGLDEATARRIYNAMIAQAEPTVPVDEIS